MNFRLEIKLTVNSSWFRVAMWAKHKQSEIQMVKTNSTSASSNTCLYWWERNLLPKIKLYYKILPAYHNSNLNDQKNSQKLQIWTASSKNRSSNFHLKIKLTVNSSWFREAMWAKHKQSEIRMVKRNSTNASSNNCLYGGERNLLSAIKLFL